MPRIGAYEENPVTPRFETQQVKLKLTEDEAILAQLERKGRIRYDDPRKKRGKFVVIQFDGRELRFYQGKTQTVGKLVANALRRESAVIMDHERDERGETDSLTAEVLPFLEVVSEFNMFEGDPSAEAPAKLLPKTACPVCHVDQKTYPRLSRHLMEKHSHGEDAEEQEQEQEPEKAEAEANFDASDGELEKE